MLGKAVMLQLGSVLALQLPHSGGAFYHAAATQLHDAVLLLTPTICHAAQTDAIYNWLAVSGN